MPRATISDVQELEIKGPWTTKSDAELSVLFGLNQKELDSFFNYDETELKKLSQDVRGLRMYRVSGLKNQAKGANEWHRVKKEIIFVTRGSVHWLLADADGNTKEYTLTPESQGIIIPPFILHAYTALEDDCEIIVITNTLFVVDDPGTHDFYEPSLLTKES
jgi:dTDP-4-dehydrorhamnose 3,5-epimerase-like enzyme